MINQNINVKKISLSVIVVLIIISVIFYQNQNNSEMKNEVIKQTIQTDVANKSEIKQVSENNETIVHSNDDTIVSEPEKIVEPKEYSVIAEEILYPDEYDFGDILDDTVIAAVGKPIKFDALPIAHAKIGDTIELEFDGKTFTAEVLETRVKHYEPDQTDQGTYQTTFRFDSRLDPSNHSTWKNQIDGYVTYDKNGVVRGDINIQDRGGDYEIYINKQVAYYALAQEAEAEFARQGYKYD